MSVQFAPKIEDEQRIAEIWLAEFADALAAGDAPAAAGLFIPDGHWRDVLAFTWTIATHSGRAAIEQALQPTLARTRAKGLTLIPLRLYIDEHGRAKLDLGLARGKQLHDKRRTIAERDAKRDLERELSDARRGR